MEILLQLIGLLFSVFMLYITFTHFKRGDLTSKDLTLWGISWIILALFVMFPGIFEGFAHSLSIKGTLQLIILVSIGFLFIVSFAVYQKMRLQEIKVNKLISAVALKENEKKN